MRVSNDMISRIFLLNLENSVTRILRIQERISTGRRINRPSDDPIGTTKALNLRMLEKLNEQYQKNIEDASSWLNFNDSVLDDLQTALNRAKGIAIQGSDSTLNTEDRSALANETNQLLEHIFSIANSKFRGKYLFSGTQTTTPPYIATRDGITGEITAVASNPAGLDGEIQREIGQGVRLSINVSGNDVFTKGVDIFQTLMDLRDALKADDPGQVADVLDDLDTASHQLITAQSRIGAKENRVESALSWLQDENLNIVKLLSETEDADFIKEIADLEQQEVIYQSTLALGGRIILPSLIDFIK
jgi:flagellar hook-associated protein 3 FlgL